MLAPRFTPPARAASAYASLRDIILGASPEDDLGARDRTAIELWCEEHRDLATRAPFRDLLLQAGDLLSDPADADAHRGLSHVLEAYGGDFTYYRADAGGIRELHAVCRGIVADGRVDDAAVYGLRNWLLMHAHLRSTYPYDELVATVTGILADDVIEPHERQGLLRQLEALEA